MKEEIVLNKIEREIIFKIREITQKDYIVILIIKL